MEVGAAEPHRLAREEVGEGAVLAEPSEQEEAAETELLPELGLAAGEELSQPAPQEVLAEQAGEAEVH